MLLTKETYSIHAVVLVASAATVSITNRICQRCPWPKVRALFTGDIASPGNPPPAQNPIFGTWLGGWPGRDLQAVALTCVLLVFFFYSGGLLDWSSLPGLWETYTHWFATGTAGKSGHEKPWFYWLELMARYEWPTLLGLALSPALLWPRTDRFIRFLAISGLGTLAAFTLIAYKTPWCIICLQWPFMALAGWGLGKMLEPLGATRATRSRMITTCAAAALLLLATSHSLWRTLPLNFQRFTDENEPYVYVQTHLEINRLLDPLKSLVASDPRNFQLQGYILTQDKYPMLWQLADFPNVTFAASDPFLAVGNADFLLVDSENQAQTEAQLHAPFFREELRLRGSYPTTALLYLRQERFAPFFPGRNPEYQPATGPVPP